MAIGPKTTAHSGGDDSWMGSRHAVAEAHPGTLDAAAFLGADGVTDGVVPSGYPLVDLGDTYGPYSGDPGDPGGTPPVPAEVLYGFSIGDRDISDGDEPTAVLWHGRIKVANLPIDFEVPQNRGAFVFEEA